MNAKILITGANGFVGRYFVQRFLQDKIYEIYATSRGRINTTDQNLVLLSGIDIVKNKNWMAELNSIDYVIHCAGIAHGKYRSPESIKMLNAVNVSGTINLVRQAIKNRVKKFIFISSVKVNGENSKLGIMHADDIPKPIGSYASSKLQAENQLRLLTKGTKTRLVIVRPPLIYGPGVKANFLKLIRAISRSYLIPTSCFSAYRSYVYLENLYDFINVCLLNPNADGEIFLLSDGEDLTLDQLIVLILRILDKKPFMLPVPYKIIKLFLKLLGRKSEVIKLLDPLQVSIAKNENLLQWTPKISLETGLRQTLFDKSMGGLLSK